MNAPHAYRRHQHAAWTRIDMLLAIYDATITSLEAGLTALAADDRHAFAKHHLKAAQLLVLLIDGIDVDSGETATRIRALCTFAISQIGTMSNQGWHSALDIVRTLREGFEGIREEARELEAQGVIPRLDQETSRTVLIG